MRFRVSAAQARGERVGVEGRAAQGVSSTSTVQPKALRDLGEAVAEHADRAGQQRVAG